MCSYIFAAILFTVYLKRALGSNYYENTNVQQLNGDDFYKKVKSSGVSIVEFHTDSCSQCKEFSKVYKDLATVFKDVLPVVAVNDENVSSKYRVKSFPTVKLFLGKGPDKDPEVVDFHGHKELDALVTFTVKALNKHVKDKASKLKPKRDHDYKKVYQLTAANFKSTVLDDTFSQWLVKFYAPWCGHCKNLEPEWNKMPKMSKGVKVGKVDCTVNQSLCSEYKVQGYPTILLFNKGDKSPKAAVDYQGPRRADAILEFAKKRDSRLAPPTHAKTVAVLREKCSGPLCLLFFLPAASKDDHLKTLDSLSSRSSMPFGLTYTLVGEHEQWESVFALKEFPAAVGLNMAKRVFLPLDASFSKENLDSFVSSILSGKVKGQRLEHDLVDATSTEL